MPRVKKHKKNNKKNKYIKIGSIKIKKSVSVLILASIILIAIFAFWRNSYLWPWPSQNEIDQRLTEVVDGCVYNENSRACKSLTSKYGITFSYCHSLGDIPEIDKPIPVYGVAKLNTFRAASLNYEPPKSDPGSTIPSSILPSLTKTQSGGHGISGASIYPYYDCSSTIEEISKEKNSEIIKNADTVSLYNISQIPQFSFSGCTLHIPTINGLWSQIPNIESTVQEGKNLIKIYNKCNMEKDLRASMNKINEKFKNYANSPVIVQFLSSFDEWNTTGATCVYNAEDEFTRKFYSQRCGLGLNGDKDTLKDFTNVMKLNMHSDFFTSKSLILK